jgi:hypothetical protein
MEYLYYQLHVSASTFTSSGYVKLIKGLYNLYGILWRRGGGARSRFTKVGGMKLELEVEVLTSDVVL